MNIIKQNSSGESRRWYIVAKNEYRLIINSIMPNHKLWFLPLLTTLSFIYVTFIAPMIVDLIFLRTMSILFSNVAIIIIQLMFFAFFLFFMTFPISILVKDLQTNKLELWLGSPMKSSELLIGEFIGRIPYYSILGILFGGFFAALMGSIGLDAIQILIVIFIFVMNFLIAYWIGTVTASILRTRLMKLRNGRDIGKALAIISVFPSIIIIYALLGGILNGLKDPESIKLIRDMLMILPSSWGAITIQDFIYSPGDFALLGFDSYLPLFVLTIFFIFILYLGFKITERSYNLEPISFSSSEVNAHGIFFRIITKIFCKTSFSLIIVTHFKNFGRKFENISKLTYSVGLMAILLIFISKPDDQESVYVFSQILPVLLGSFAVVDITLDGKENLLLYRYSSLSEKRYIFSKYLQYWLIITPIAVLFEIILSIITAGFTFEALLVNIFLITILATAIPGISIGLFLLNPVYDDKADSANLMINLQIIIICHLLLFFFILITFTNNFYEKMFIDAFIMALMGILFIFIGIRRLRKIE